MKIPSSEAGVPKLYVVRVLLVVRKNIPGGTQDLVNNISLKILKIKRKMQHRTGTVTIRFLY